MPEGGYPPTPGRFAPLSKTGKTSYSYNMEITTKVRRTHLGPRYDIYVDGVYSATAYTAREIEPIIEYLERKYL
jgi:hypothetical protein